MDLHDIAQLIEVRKYIISCIDTYTISKGSINQLRKMLLVIDKRLVDGLLSDGFKQSIGFEDADAIVTEAVKINNIKSGIHSSTDATNKAVVISTAGDTKA